jgi:hypothetical protein
MHAICSAHLTPIDFITPIVNTTNCENLPYAVHLSHLLLSAFSQRPIPFPSLKVVDQV